jgi:hypothetical protein
MEYETLEAEYVEYGRNKFIEIAKKRIVDENAVFINISKGYVAPNGQRRYQKSIGFQPDEQIVTGIIEKLGQVWSTVTEEEKETVKKEEGAEQEPLED